METAGGIFQNLAYPGPAVKDNEPGTVAKGGIEHGIWLGT